MGNVADGLSHYRGDRRKLFRAKYGVDCPYDIRDNRTWLDVQHGVAKFHNEEMCRFERPSDKNRKQKSARWTAELAAAKAKHEQDVKAAGPTWNKTQLVKERKWTRA